MVYPGHVRSISGAQTCDFGPSEHVRALSGAQSPSAEVLQKAKLHNPRKMRIFEG